MALVGAGWWGVDGEHLCLKLVSGGSEAGGVATGRPDCLVWGWFRFLPTRAPQSRKGHFSVTSQPWASISHL